jgi:Toprim-like
VVNIQLYYPDSGTKPNKFNLPGLPMTLYGLDRLSADMDKLLFLCEGSFDVIALDYHLGKKRERYDILATPGGFQEKWVDHFKGRKVRAVYDNDDAGRKYGERVKKLLAESGSSRRKIASCDPSGGPRRATCGG